MSKKIYILLIFCFPLLISATINLPYYIPKSYEIRKTDSPRAFIVAGIHGDEIGGYLSAVYLYKKLKLSKGDIKFIPFLNIKSIVRTYRYLEGVGDVNEKFVFSNKNELSIPEDVFNKINFVKKELINFKPDFVLSFHSGWGFSYNDRRRWGNSITIDEKKHGQIDLYTVAFKVLSEINRNNRYKRVKYSIKILNTFSNNVVRDMNDFSTWVLKNNIPVFTIESSKNSVLWRQIYNISFATLEFLKIYGFKVSNVDEILDPMNIRKFLKSIRRNNLKFKIYINGVSKEYKCGYKQKLNIFVNKNANIVVPDIELNDVGYFLVPYSEINYKHSYNFYRKIMFKIKFLVVYDILCKLEKWDNLLGNTPQIPTPGGKNGTTEDFTRPS
ncbi:M99 family carboxypeptidase catalytic domain-containing protein [Desulfurobacterium indicum]|uniref:D,L-carboxypeptidase peptidase domain-containing protein n=1 Tax=Desulfurobacterium indicum TaxID=1914305 RepID=A0A1R1MKM8_9BACT|nr:M99 family carboxypeptidase catalytic domain-containing protein [Desulfurobacterium indicum]OMH40313.1 hypothetical protein BLW93_05745 [Desulfurobacterium indicum]